MSLDTLCHCFFQAIATVQQFVGGLGWLWPSGSSACGGMIAEGGMRRGECIDGDERCVGWAAEGECKKNPGYMLTSCRLSCHSCDPSSKEEAAAAL